MSTPATFKQQQKKQAQRSAAATADVMSTGKTVSADTKMALKPLTETRPTTNKFSSYRTSNRIDFTDDKASGKAYTSFEKQPYTKDVTRSPREYNNNRRPTDAAGDRVQRPLQPQIVEDVPIDVDTDDVKLDASKVVCFNGRNSYLSNLFLTPVLIDGHEYSSVEHYYQACKLYMLGGAPMAAQIRKVSDPGHCKVFAKKLLRGVASYQQVEDWKRNQAPAILKHAILQKFLQHAGLKERLLCTGDAILAHTYDRDNFFATGCDQKGVEEWAKQNDGHIIKTPSDLANQEYFKYIPLVGNGKNLLGAICMQVRKAIRLYKNNQTDTTDPVMLAMFETMQINYK